MQPLWEVHPTNMENPNSAVTVVPSDAKEPDAS